MVVEILSMEWEHEDELPETTDLEYGLMHEYSRIIDGVRMFPFIRLWDGSTDREKIIYLGA